MVETKEKEKVEKMPEMDAIFDYLTADEILERKVVKIGNGAHVNIPLKHLGKDVKIIIKPTGGSEQKT